jgi:hypothetical protein
MPQRGNVSVSYSAFEAPSSGDSVAYSYHYGMYNTGTATIELASAPLQLPHGATITNATFYFYDNDAGNSFDFYVMRGTGTTAYDVIGYVDNMINSETPGYSSVSLSSFYTPGARTVDNNNYHYYLLMRMPYSSTSSYYYRFYYALIEYELPA